MSRCRINRSRPSTKPLPSGSGVAVTMGAKKGRVSIEFADLEDLERIYRRMVP